MAGEILLRAIKRNALLKGRALINMILSMILSDTDILREGDVVKTEDGDTFGTLTNRNYIGQPVARLLGVLGSPGWYIVRDIDIDRIIARLEEIRVSIWAED